MRDQGVWGMTWGGAGGIVYMWLVEGGVRDTLASE